MTDPELPEFEPLLTAARGGDKDALNDLFRHFYPRVSRKVHISLATDMRANRPWLHARFSTGDVVQEVFRSVLLDLNSFGGKTEDAFTGYLAMVVRNRIIDEIRHHQAEKRDGRLGAPEAEHSASETDDPAALAEAAEQRRKYELALLQFGEREQLLLRARFEGTAGFTALAEQLGYANETAARRAFFDAQARLAVKLKGLVEDEGAEGEA